MFSEKVMSILAKTLGVVTLFGAGAFFVSGFFVAAEEAGSASEKVGYFIGYEITGLAGFAFIYLILGALSRANRST